MRRWATSSLTTALTVLEPWKTKRNCSTTPFSLRSRRNRKICSPGSALAQGGHEPQMAVDVAVELLLHPEHAIQVKQLEGSFSGDFESDYEFVRDRFSWEEATEKIAAYKQLDILAG